MFPAQVARRNSDGFSRCEEPEQKTDHGKYLSPAQKADATVKEYVDRAIWKDDVLRAIEYYEIAVHVKNGVVYLDGHIVSTTSQGRIENAIRAIPGILGIQNNLVLDDKLTLQVSTSLGELEHTYGCKFFTGTSHGVVSLNGNVSDADVKLLAEKCAASNPNVRGVINNVRVSGAEVEFPDQPFLQPSIGETVYFLDGLSGIVKQVIVNPNNRRVVAMTVWGHFPDQQQDVKSLKNRDVRSPGRLAVVSMEVVRYMTRVSGFLNINSHERKRYVDFDSGSFRSPNPGWTPPYPYCADNVLFSFEPREVEYQILEHLPRPPLVVSLQEQALWEQLLANDSLGG
jgi:osmotically-inducible protein OsmY